MLGQYGRYVLTVNVDGVRRIVVVDYELFYARDIDCRFGEIILSNPIL